jgi:hypothetical protein
MGKEITGKVGPGARQAMGAGPALWRRDPHDKNWGLVPHCGEETPVVTRDRAAEQGTCGQCKGLGVRLVPHRAKRPQPSIYSRVACAIYQHRHGRRQSTNRARKQNQEAGTRSQGCRNRLRGGEAMLCSV